MKKRLLTVLAGLFLVAGNAMAEHCPVDMKKIDAALAAKPNLSAQQLNDVKKLRAEGEALHNSGKHKESVDTLAKALKILEAK